MMIRACTLIFALLVAGAASAQPSFNCAKAGTVIEHAICDNADLAALDSDMAAAYGEARKVAKAMDDHEPSLNAQSNLKAAQRAWIGRRDACEGADAIEACIAYEYGDRIDLMKLVYQLTPPGAYPVEKELEKPERAPDAVIAALGQTEDCDASVTGTGFTAVYDLDKGYQLWEVECWIAAYNSGSGFVVMPYDRPDEAEVVHFEAPPGKPDYARDSLTLPNVDLSEGRIYSFHKGRGLADCGSFRVYGWNGLSTVRLLELRVKDDCDEQFTDPDKYPLVYRAW
ncbi:MAG: DUF1176 domain-containing protein [Rhodobiaceae bacterium]|nr:DUF1176 domain-containing protein [Rhodobiaceae bacterium]